MQPVTAQWVSPRGLASCRVHSTVRTLCSIALRNDHHLNPPGPAAAARTNHQRVCLRLNHCWCDDVVHHVATTMASHVATAASANQLGRLGLGVVAQIDGLRLRLRLVVAPRFAPKPLLRQRVDRHHVLRVVGQVLVEIRQRVRVLRKLLVPILL